MNGPYTAEDSPSSLDRRGRPRFGEHQFQRASLEPGGRSV